MTSRRDTARILLTFGSLALAACQTSECPTQSIDSTVTGSIVTGGRTSWPLTTVGVALTPPEEDRCPGPPGCTSLVYEGWSLQWSTPSARGSYSLKGLSGEVCESPDPEAVSPRWTCAPLVGTLTVLAVSPDCQPGSCDRYEAELVLDGTPSGSGPSAVGQAHLVYSVTHGTEACGGGFGNQPFGLN